MSNYLNTADNEWYKQRLTGVIICVLAAYIVLIGRLFYLQVIEREEYRRLSENNCIRLQHIDPPRGLIFDHNGKLLVDNRPSFDLSIILKDAKPVKQTIEKLSNYTKIPLEELQSCIDRNKGMSPYKPILIKNDIGRDILATIEAHQFDLPGIKVTVKPLRYYINEQSGAHLIGYLSQINAPELKSGKYPKSIAGVFIGKYGVEKAFENYLCGIRGGRQVEVNANGQVVRILRTVDAQPGKNIYLTIDQAVQEKAEELLENFNRRKL